DPETGEVHNILGYDQLPMFSDDHEGPDGTTQSNLGEGSEIPWYILSITSSIMRPVIFQKRSDLEFVSKQSLTDDEMFYRKRFVFGVDARYNVKFGPWQQARKMQTDLDGDAIKAGMTAMRTVKN